MNEGYGRRHFLYHAGAAVAAGTLAGCAGGNGSSDGSGGDSTPRTGAVAGGETAATGTAGSTDTRPVTEPAPQRVDQFLENATFYDGNMVVGVSRVAVGARRNGRLGFDPAAIKVATGTEVTWEWVNARAEHSVMSVGTPKTNSRTFDSGQPQAGSNVTYRYTFEQPGFYPYVCGVHQGQGARGVVLVERGQNVGGPGSG